MFAYDSLTMKTVRGFSGHMAGLVLAVAGTVLLSFGGVAHAQNDGLIVAPTILEFEGRDRYATLTLVNRGAQTHSYRIRFINQKMLENGQMADTDSPAEGEGFAAPYIRYSPRQITLSPGKPQTVRVMLRKAPDMQDGEYRSHLLFQQIPDTMAPVASLSEDSGLGVSITAKFGVSIPTFIRIGQLTAAAEIDGMTQLGERNGRAVLGFVIHRQGDKTVRGHLSVFADGKKIGYMSGLPVYLSTDKRRIEMDLESKSLAGKKIRVEYKAREKDGGQILAQAEKQF